MVPSRPPALSKLATTLPGGEPGQLRRFWWPLVSGDGSAAWRDKRNRILDLHGGRCSYCDVGEDKVRMNVHHRYYEQGKKPWDYPDETLDCLCPKCHGAADEERRKIVRCTGWLDRSNSERARGYMDGISAVDRQLAEIEITGGYEYCEGLGDVFLLSAETVIDLLPHRKKKRDKTFVSLHQLLSRSGHHYHRSEAARTA